MGRLIFKYLYFMDAKFKRFIQLLRFYANTIQNHLSIFLFIYRLLRIYIEREVYKKKLFYEIYVN